MIAQRCEHVNWQNGVGDLFPDVFDRGSGLEFVGEDDLLCMRTVMPGFGVRIGDITKQHSARFHAHVEERLFDSRKLRMDKFSVGRAIETRKRKIVGSVRCV